MRLTAMISAGFDSLAAAANDGNGSYRLRRRSRALRALRAPGLLAALVLAGCGEVTGPAAFVRNRPPRVVRASPLVERPVVVVGEAMVFSVEAEDPDGDVLHYAFSLEGSLAASADSMTFQPEAVGEVCLTAVVTDGLLSDSHVWYPRVIPEPDSNALAVVEVLSAGPGVEPGSLRVSWLAVGDDGMAGRPARYLVRTHDLPIVTEDLWLRGTPHGGVPEPAAPGQPMEMVITRSGFAQYTSVAVRAEDEAGNLSPLGLPGGGFTRGLRISGEVLDPVTGAGIPDAYVSIGVFATRSDDDGRWELAEVSDVVNELVVSDDGEIGIIGDYYDLKLPNLGENDPFYQARLLPSYSLSSSRYTGFLQYFTWITTLPGLTYPSYQRHWALPIDVHVPPFEKGGLDYAAVIQAVIAELESALGMDVFRIVSEPPLVGVACEFRSDILRDYYRIDELSSDENPVRGTVAFRTVYTAADQTVFARTIRHEFGHVLGLHHSIDDAHMMYGGTSAPKVDGFASEEVQAIRVIYGFPSNSDADFGDYLND